MRGGKATNSIRIFVAAIAVAGLECSSLAQLAIGPFTAVQSAVLPIFDADRLEPIAIIRMENVRSDFEKRGFFKIGLLRTFVASGFDAELARREDLGAFLERFPTRMPGELGDTLNFVGFCLRVRGVGQPIIEARQVLWRRSDDFLSMKACSAADRPDHRRDFARLFLKGPNAGLLLFDRDSAGSIPKSVKPNVIENENPTCP